MFELIRMRISGSIDEEDENWMRNNSWTLCGQMLVKIKCRNGR